MLEAFWRNWPECLREAPHFSNVVTVALILRIENDLTLMHEPRLLTNSEFREQCLEGVTDRSVVEFFHGARPCYCASSSILCQLCIGIGFSPTRIRDYPYTMSDFPL
jgi:hypothetical protein